MITIENDFSHFDRLDWSLKYRVDIRFIVELLADKAASIDQD